MRSYYLLSGGRLRRKQNTVHFEDTDGPSQPVPVDEIDALFLFGEISLNTRLLNFLARKRVLLHVFNYYGFYAGTWYPRSLVRSGSTVVLQAQHYLEGPLRVELARQILHGAGHSMRRTLAYYAGRETPAPVEQPNTTPPYHGAPAAPQDAEEEAALDGPPPAVEMDQGAAVTGEGPLRAREQTLYQLAATLDEAHNVPTMMGVEGRIREQYYAAWPLILKPPWTFTHRTRRPPGDEINALISFGNALLYTATLNEIYRTALDPTVSFLHEPGDRRFSLALDLPEIFKPLIVDRLIFRLANTGQLRAEHFARVPQGIYLSEAGKRVFVAAFDERLRATIRHRALKRHVSYRQLIRLECHALMRHIRGEEPYQSFRAWW